MKKILSCIFYILLSLVVFFFVFGMGRSVYEGFQTCTVNAQCPQVTRKNKTYCGACQRGFCQAGKLKSKGVPCT